MAGGEKKQQLQTERVRKTGRERERSLSTDRLHAIQTMVWRLPARRLEHAISLALEMTTLAEEEATEPETDPQEAGENASNEMDWEDADADWEGDGSESDEGLEWLEDGDVRQESQIHADVLVESVFDTHGVPALQLVSGLSPLLLRLPQNSAAAFGFRNAICARIRHTVALARCLAEENTAYFLQQDSRRCSIRRDKLRERTGLAEDVMSHLLGEATLQTPWRELLHLSDFCDTYSSRETTETALVQALAEGAEADRAQGLQRPVKGKRRAFSDAQLADRVNAVLEQQGLPGVKAGAIREAREARLGMPNSELRADRYGAGHSLITMIASAAAERQDVPDARRERMAKWKRLLTPLSAHGNPNVRRTVQLWLEELPLAEPWERDR